MSKFDVVVIGEAVLDMYVTVHDERIVKTDDGKLLEFRFGSKTEVDDYFISVGGGGANVSTGLSRQNLDTCFITALGNDNFAVNIISKLKKEKVNLSHIVSSDIHTGIGIILPGDGRNKDRTILSYRGSNTTIKFSDIENVVSQNENIVFCALFGNASNVIPKSIKQFKDKRFFVSLGTKEILDFGKDISEFIEDIDYLVFNIEEAGTLLDVLKIKSRDDKENIKLNSNEHMYNVYLHEIIKKISSYTKLKTENNTYRNVIITLGADGVIGIDKNGKIYRYKSCSHEGNNTTGLGDAFFSGFISHIVMGKSFADSIEFGLKNSASVMKHTGATTGLLRKARS